MKLKENTTGAQVAEDLLRKYLIHSYPVISKNYPEVAGIEPANAADFLIHLQASGRIRLELFNESPAQVGCRIVELDAAKA